MVLMAVALSTDPRKPHLSSGKKMLSRNNFPYSPLQNPCHNPCHFVPPSAQSNLSHFSPVIKNQNILIFLNFDPSQEITTFESLSFPKIFLK